MRPKSRVKGVISAFLTLSVLFTAFICGAVPATAAASVGVTYQSQIQSIGWQKAATNGSQSGTTGRALRLEALKISLTGAPAGAAISYQAQVQRYGWQSSLRNGAMAGTAGKALRLEAIKITLTGLPGYAVQYRAYVQRAGWQGWITVQNGTALSNAAYAGTVGRAMRVEAIEIRIVPPVVTSAVLSNVTTAAGTAPVMPTTVTVNMSDNTTKSVPVTWDSIDASQYLYGGVFYLSGTIAGTTVQAQAEIRVTSTTAWSVGWYLVGTDIPAGEYVIVDSSDEGGLFAVSSDMSGDEDSIITADMFLNRDIVTVSDGQYLTLLGGVMYKAADAPAVDISSGTLPDGMYKVGTDIPAGSYTLTPTGDSSPMGAYQISDNSLHSRNPAPDITIISASRTITLTAGTYIQTSGCNLTINPT